MPLPSVMMRRICAVLLRSTVSLKSGTRTGSAAAAFPVAFARWSMAVQTTLGIERIHPLAAAATHKARGDNDNGAKFHSSVILESCHSMRNSDAPRVPVVPIVSVVPTVFVSFDDLNELNTFKRFNQSKRKDRVLGLR